MARRARLRLLGDGWAGYAGYTIPDDRILEVSEEEAANFLRERGSSRKVEFLGWLEDRTDDEQRPPT